MRNTRDMQPKPTALSWIQLGIFTAFLFLLVAIPYTIYLKSAGPKSVTIADIPTQTKPIPMPTITPPLESSTTTCIPVPNTYINTFATPSAYFFQNRSRTLCFPPSLPPFPFTWQPYTSYQYGYSLDTPSNWVDETTTIQQVTLHIFAEQSSSNTSAVATPATSSSTISFARYAGVDPYATQAAYLQQKIARSGHLGTVYTKGPAFIAAVFPISTGYLLLEASQEDNAFYAFEHMLDSLQFSK